MKLGEISSNGRVIRRRDKRIWFVVLGVFVAVFLFSFMTQKFKPGGSRRVPARRVPVFL